METLATPRVGAGSLADLAELILNVAREVRFRGYDDDSVVTLNPSDASVMRFIDRHPGTTPSSVAHATGLQRSNISTALRTLESHGLIERRSDPADHRAVRVFATARAAENLALLHGEWTKQIAAALGEDLTQVSAAITLLQRLETGLIVARQA